VKRFTAIVLLALLCGQAAADITMLLGPDGKQLPNGKYRLLVIPSDAAKVPINTVLDVGGTDGPIPPIPPAPTPQPDTLDARLTLLLAAVEDTEKAVTGAKLQVAYEMTLKLTANSITDANSLRGVMAGIEKGVLDSLKKTAGWQPWVTGLAEITKPLDFDGAKQTYAAAAAKLGGGVVPPPVPPPTPTPDNPYSQPTAAMLTAAQSVSAVKTNRTDATKLAELYDSAKRLVLSAPAARAAGTKPEIGTTAELRQWLIDNGKPLNLQGKHTGLADAVDKFLGQQLGTAVRDVKDADATALAALAWAIWEGGR
jgi:hypothetical protein